jgi:hypothetical protein
VTTAAPSTHSVLGVLGKERLVDLGRFIDVRLTTKQTRDDQIKTLLQSGVLDFERALSFMRREELKSACRAHGLDASGRARDQLVERLRVLRGERKKGPPTGELMHVATRKRDLPIRGDIVSARHRQWLVEDVKLPPQVGQQHLVSLVCLDDDNQGREPSADLGARARRDDPAARARRASAMCVTSTRRATSAPTSTR